MNCASSAKPMPTVNGLEKALSKEQADVEPEGRSLAAFLLSGGWQNGRKADQRAAGSLRRSGKIRCCCPGAGRHSAGFETMRRRAELTFGLSRLATIPFLQEKTLAVKAAGGPTAEKILQLEERNGYLDSQKRELQEALIAGNAALSCADQILSELNSAEGWGTWDLVGGGGLLSNWRTAIWTRHRLLWKPCSRCCVASKPSWPM